MEFYVDNVNNALSECLNMLAYEGVLEGSRNGQVLAFREPVLTTYQQPTERVLWCQRRDANPYFQLMEALWMLAGRNDVQWIQQFNSKFGQFSDDNVTFHGAYGNRWRHWFGYDQLAVLAKELQANPESRRCVLTMWDAHGLGRVQGNYPQSLFHTMDLAELPDLMYGTASGKDVPCNTHAYVDCRDQRLNLTVCCRSNDLWLGAYGANAVHFSVLQELLAAWAGVPVGVYRQFSNNMHWYTSKAREVGIEVRDNGEWRQQMHALAGEIESDNLYLNCGAESGDASTVPLVHSSGADAVHWWFADLQQFMQNPLPANPFTWRHNFFRDVAVPVYRSWMQRKNKHGTGLGALRDMPVCDWRTTCMQWIARAELKKEQRAAQRPDTAASA